MPDETAEDFTTVTPEQRKRADKYYDHARKVAEASQYDYAIEMYLQGLEHDPGNVEIHKELRNVALLRKGPGKGKPLGSFASMKLKRVGKDVKANFINARKLLAYDPGSAAYMEMLAKAAAKMQLAPVVVWIGPMLYRALLDDKNPKADSFLNLKKIFESVGEYRLAIDALNQAAALRPDDSDLQHELRSLSAQMTMKESKLDQVGGNFRDSLKDADKQRELLEKDSDIRTVDAMQGQIARARAEFEADPSVAGKLVKLVETLTKTGELKYENEALELLEKAAKENNNYRWRFAADEVKIKQFARGERMLKQVADAEPDNAEARRELAEFRREKAAMELKHFQGAMKAYPTDNRFKFEAGRRLFALGEYTEAIPVLQQCQGDAKYKDDARLMLGKSFLKAEYVDEAVDTLRNLIESYKVDADDKAKEMYYWYGRALEEKGDVEDALKAYSQIAQWDFGYEDVQARIKDLRARR